jgi:hypothetical protein
MLKLRGIAATAEEKQPRQGDFNSFAANPCVEMNAGLP